MSTRRRATPSIASGAPSRSTSSACADRSSPWPHGPHVDPWVTSPRPPSEGWYSGPVAAWPAWSQRWPLGFVRLAPPGRLGLGRGVAKAGPGGESPRTKSQRPLARSHLHGHPPLRTEAHPLAQGCPSGLERREPSPRACRRGGVALTPGRRPQPLCPPPPRRWWDWC